MLIKTIEEIQKFIPTTVNFGFNNIKPIIEKQVEPILIDTILGSDQYDDLNTKYNAGGSLSVYDQKLLDLCQNYLSHYSYWIYIPIGNVMIGASGIHVSTGQDKAVASQYRTEELKATFQHAAFSAEESLLAYLENNTGAFALWAASSQRTEYLECFINTAPEFNKHFNINSSRRLFRALKPIMLEIEQHTIMPVLCSDLFAEIKDQILNNNVSPANESLLKFIKPVVVHYTLARAAIDLPVQITPEGMNLLSTSDRQTMNVSTPPFMDRLQAFAASRENVGSTYMARLKDCLIDNLSDYPLFENSDCYNNPSEEEEDDDVPILML